MGEVPESKFKLEMPANASQPFESNVSHPTKDTKIKNELGEQQIESNEGLANKREPPFETTLNTKPHLLAN